jgi:hypothetical protein
MVSYRCRRSFPQLFKNRTTNRKREIARKGTDWVVADFMSLCEWTKNLCSDVFMKKQEKIEQIRDRERNRRGEGWTEKCKKDSLQ